MASVVVPMALVAFNALVACLGGLCGVGTIRGLSLPVWGQALGQLKVLCVVYPVRGRKEDGDPTLSSWVLGAGITSSCVEAGLES